MKIAAATIDPQSLTVLEIATDDGKPPWVLLPFEDQRAEIDQLDERHVLARGLERGYAIYDTAERRVVLDVRAPNSRYLRWFFSPLNRAVFVAEASPGQTPANGIPSLNGLRELSLDGVSRFRLIDEAFYVDELYERDDGALIAPRHDRLAIFYPRDGSAELHAYPGFKFDRMKRDEFSPRWFSRSGRYFLRPHLGSILRTRGDEAGHPDLQADGRRRYGMALDLFETAPVRFVRTIPVRYLLAEEIVRGGDPARLAALDALADQFPGDDSIAGGRYRGDVVMESFVERDTFNGLHRLVRCFKHVQWAPDDQAFDVIWEHYPQPQQKRRIGLDGSAGDVEQSLWGTRRPQWPAPSEAAIKAVRKSINAKAVQKIVLPDTGASSVLAALEETAHRVEAGLKTIIFRDSIQFRYKIGEGRGAATLDEPGFFAIVRALEGDDATQAVTILRRLLASYCAQARDHKCSAADWINSGGEPEAWRAALSDAALALAELDDRSFEHLRDWFQSVDQAHDSFAGDVVFPAVAKRTKFATPEAARFGVWFALRLWQNLSYDLALTGLVQAWRKHWDAPAFLKVVTEELATRANVWGPDRHALDGVKPDLLNLLSDNSSWSIVVRRGLEEMQRG